jgi:predicted aspartyl protease
MMRQALAAFALVVFALIVLAGCAGSKPETKDAAWACRLTPVAEMPVQTDGRMLFVQATTLGVPVTLLVDTGAERTLLTEAAVERLHLPRDYQHATRTYGIGNTTATWDATLPDGLTLGGKRFPLATVAVGHFSLMPVTGHAADGLLGADVLLASDIDLDLPNHRLTLYRTRDACPEAGPPWLEHSIGLAGIATRGNRLLVPFELDGVGGMGVLDTGAQLSSISINMAQRIGLEEAGLAGDGTVMAYGAALDLVAVRIHRFRELRVGPALMQEPMLPEVPMTTSMGDALLGADFLQGRRIWLSFATQTVFVTPLEPRPLIADAR